MNKLEYLYKEMLVKLQFYAYLAEKTHRVTIKILAGLDTDKKVSNMELFAALMIYYFEDVKPKLVHFSHRFKEIV